MSIKVEYTDLDGRITEAEVYILPEYNVGASSPVRTGPNGKIPNSLIPPSAEHEIHYLTQDQIDNSRIILSKTPVYNSIRFIPDGALPQRNSIDFAYRGLDNSVAWDGLELDGFLELGELVEIFYQSTNN